MKTKCQRNLIALMCGFLGLAASATAETSDGWVRRVVSKDAVKLEIFRKGQGPAVLMHPSLGRPAQDFEDLGNRIVLAGYSVVMINPRGIGGSTGPLKGVTLHNLAADIWTIADELKIDRAFVLGQNFGNRVSRTASADQPDRVIGLILLAAGGEVAPSKEVMMEFWKVFDPGLPPKEHLQAVADSFFAPGNSAALWKDGWHGETARLQAEAAERTDFKRVASGGVAPALVIQGLQDRIAPPINAWKFVVRRPNARLVAIPNMGHAMLPEQPEAIASSVIAFLKEQCGARATDDGQKLSRSFKAPARCVTGVNLPQ